MPLKLIKDLIQFIKFPTNHEKDEVGLLDPNRPVVILVGGLSSTNDSLRIIKRRLSQDGFSVVVHTISIEKKSNSEDGLVFFANQLRDLVQSLRNSPVLKNQKVFLLAHSAGGLIARHYIQFLEGNQHCDGLVTLATPHRGLWIAALGFLTKLKFRSQSLFDILPFSEFVRSLNSHPFPSDFPILSLSSIDDLICSQKNCRLPLGINKLKLSEEKLIDGVSHIGFLIQRRPYLVVRGWILERIPVEKALSESQHFKKSS